MKKIPNIHSLKTLPQRKKPLTSPPKSVSAGGPPLKYLQKRKGKAFTLKNMNNKEVI